VKSGLLSQRLFSLRRSSGFDARDCFPSGEVQVLMPDDCFPSGEEKARLPTALFPLSRIFADIIHIKVMKATKKANEMSVRELASYIDQSVLKPEFTEQEIRKYIQEGIDFGCKTVCINPASLDIAAALCEGTETGVCVVCDFPFGLSTTASKARQAEMYCSRGDILELDIVANYGWIKSGKWQDVEADMKAVSEVCHAFGTAVKVIFETDALSLGEVKRATEAAIAAGADFAKTSTGFFTGGRSDGATVEVIQAMLDAACGRIKIKGSGGIRTQQHFFQLIDMGIDRMGVGYRSTPVVLGALT
jgi:deoxyribose-phosphate aldolase